MGFELGQQETKKLRVLTLLPSTVNLNYVDTLVTDVLLQNKSI